MVFNKKKGMMVKSNVKNEVSTMGMKKNIFETKREENDDDDDFEDSDDSFEMSVDEDEEDRSDMKDQSMSNSKNAKSKLTPGGKKNMHASFQLPNKGGSATKTPKSLQNTPQSGKKNQKATSPKQNTPMPGKKNQMSAIPNKNSPMFSKKQALAAQNQSLISSGKKNQGSPVPTNLKQFGGVKPNQNPKGKSNTNVSMDNDGEDDDDEGDDDDDDEGDDEDDDDEGDDEDDGDEEDDNEDDTEDIPTPGQKIQPQNNPSKKSALANKQQQRVAKPPQNNVVKVNKNQAVSGNQNSNAVLQGKKAVKRPGALIVQQDDDEEEDDDEEDDGEEEDDDDGEEEDSDNDEEEDGDDDEGEEKKVIRKKQDMQSKQPESEKNKKGLTSETQETPKYSAGGERDSRTLFAKGFPSDTTAEEIKTLSSDILNVTFPRNKGMMPLFCFLEFESEEKADENHKHLHGKKFKDHVISVDYCGAKSTKAQNCDKDRLMCEGIPAGTNMLDIAQLFPTAIKLFLNSSADQRTAFAEFHSEEDAAEALKINENAEIQGKSIAVQYAPPSNFRKQQMNRNYSPRPYADPRPYGRPPRPFGRPPRSFGRPPRSFGRPSRSYGRPPRPYGGPAAKKQRY